MLGQLRRWGHTRGFVLEAMSGVDVALHDLLALQAGLPLFKYLGGHGRTSVKCHASSVYFASFDEMAREAAEQVARGHTAVKVKIGRNEALGGLRADVESVRAVRQAVGPGVEIMLDANSAYDAATAIRLCRHLEPLDIAWLEEPVRPDDVSGYELIRKSVSIPLAAGESEFGVFGFRDLIERHAYNLLYAPHTGFSAGVAHLASLHLAAAVPNFMTYEYFCAPNALRDIFTEPFPEPKGDMVPMPTQPGLGLDSTGISCGATR